MRTASLVSIIVFVAFVHLSGRARRLAERRRRTAGPAELAGVPRPARDSERRGPAGGHPAQRDLPRTGVREARLQGAAARQSRGRPAVLAELAGAGPQARTVLLYAHFDGQPVIPENWSQQDPFRPVVKRRDAQGKWQEVGRQAVAGEPARSRAARVRALGFRRQGADHDAADRGRSAARAAEVAGDQHQGAARSGRRDGLAEPRRHDRERPRGFRSRRDGDPRRTCSTTPAARRSCSAIAASRRRR